MGKEKVSKFKANNRDTMQPEYDFRGLSGVLPRSVMRTTAA
jgi:hypothetical protein